MDAKTVADCPACGEGWTLVELVTWAQELTMSYQAVSACPRCGKLTEWTTEGEVGVAKEYPTEEGMKDGVYRVKDERAVRLEKKKKNKLVGPCGCGCGKPVYAPSKSYRYVNDTHRERAKKRRQRARKLATSPTRGPGTT